MNKKFNFSKFKLNLLQLHSFTMAEILLSLTIIGVVAAITLPSLTGNINERTWDTQRKALYNRLSQALKILPSLNGYGAYTYTISNNNVSVAADTAAMAFVTEGLSKVLKLDQICDNTNLVKCGLPLTYSKPYNTTSRSNFPTDISTWNLYYTDRRFNPWYYINTKAAGFVTKNGESIAVFYNPFCTSKDTFFPSRTEEYYVTRKFHYAWPYMCVNFIYDLNGKKGPNRAGLDIGAITAFYSSDSVIVAAQPTSSRLRSTSYPSKTYSEAFNLCKSYDDNSRLPTLEEMMAIALNWQLFMYQDNLSGAWHTNTKDKIPNISDPSYWIINPVTGDIGIMVGSLAHKFLCVKGLY